MGDKFFAGAGLAVNQNSRCRRRDNLHLSQNIAQCETLADDFSSKMSRVRSLSPVFFRLVSIKNRFVHSTRRRPESRRIVRLFPPGNSHDHISFGLVFIWNVSSPLSMSSITK